MAEAPVDRSGKSIIIRRFAPADHAAVMELWCSAWEATVTGIDFRARWPVMLAQWDDILAAGGEAHVAVVEGIVAGFIVLDRGDTHLDQIALAPVRFGSGAGKALVDFAKARSGGQLSLTVNTFNARAVRFYEREGFVRVGEGTNAVSGLPVWTYEWRAD